jgi:hypothetical protein
MLLWMFLGRWVALLLFRGPGPDEPGDLRADSVVRLKRPDGTSSVGAYGPPDAPAIIFTHGAGANATP